MIEALEKLLSDLAQDFQRFGIAYTPGQEFPLEEHGLTNTEDAGLAFYDPEHCDGIKDDSTLRSLIAALEAPQIDANQHAYPANVGRALWNTSLRALYMTKNPGRAAANLKENLAFIEANNKYLDSQHVPTRGPRGEGVKSTSLSRAPQVVDQRTLAFASSYKTFVDAMVTNPDPLADARNNAWAIPGAAGQINKGTAKAVAGFATTQAVLKERMALYHARLNNQLLTESTYPDAVAQFAQNLQQLQQPLSGIAEKYQGHFEAVKQIEHDLKNPEHTKLAPAAKADWVKRTVSRLEDLLKNPINSQALQTEIDQLTAQHLQLTRAPTTYLPSIRLYQQPLYLGGETAATLFMSAENTAADEFQKTITQLTSYQENLAQIINDQEALLKKLQNELIATAPQLKEKLDDIKAAKLELAILNEYHTKVTLGSAQFDALTKQLHWDEEFAQLAKLKTRLLTAADQLAKADPQQPITMELFKELQQILGWDAADTQKWQYTTENPSLSELVQGANSLAGIGKLLSTAWYSAANYASLTTATPANKLLLEEVNRSLNTTRIDPKDKMAKLAAVEVACESELTAVEDAIELSEKYFGEQGQAVNYLKNRETQYAWFDKLQNFIHLPRKSPTEKMGRRTFMSDIGLLIKQYETDRNPEHLELALKKINAALANPLQFRSRRDQQKSMRAVLGKLRTDINGVLSKNTLHSRYFKDQTSQIGSVTAALATDPKWAQTLVRLTQIDESLKYYGHDTNPERIQASLEKVNALLNDWNTLLPENASYKNQLQHRLEKLQGNLKNGLIHAKYFGVNNLAERCLAAAKNLSQETILERVNYLLSIGELLELQAQDNNPEHAKKILEKIDAVLREDSQLFTEDRHQGEHSIQALLAKLRVDLNAAQPIDLLIAAGSDEQSQVESPSR